MTYFFFLLATTTFIRWFKETELCFTRAFRSGRQEISKDFNLQIICNIRKTKGSKWRIMTAAQPPWSRRPASTPASSSHSSTTGSPHCNDPLFLAKNISFSKIVNVKM
jgi:hypothetical protein